MDVEVGRVQRNAKRRTACGPHRPRESAPAYGLSRRANVYPNRRLSHHPGVSRPALMRPKSRWRALITTFRSTRATTDGTRSTALRPVAYHACPNARAALPSARCQSGRWSGVTNLVRHTCGNGDFDVVLVARRHSVPVRQLLEHRRRIVLRSIDHAVASLMPPRLHQPRTCSAVDRVGAERVADTPDDKVLVERAHAPTRRRRPPPGVRG